MGLEALAFSPRQASVERARDGLLRLLAGDDLLQLLGQRTSRTEEQRLERGRRDFHDARDLGVRASLELAEDECLALGRRYATQRVDDGGERGSLGLVVG